MLKRCIKHCGCSVLIFFSLHAFADNLGVYGQVFPIEETDFLDFIEHRLDFLQQTGQLHQLEAKWNNEIKNEVIRPHPVGLTTTTHSRKFHYDPTFVVGRDIFNTQGQLVIKKGARVNPLEQFPLFQKTLLFYNDDDNRQRIFVQKYLKNHPDTVGEKDVKPILVQGNVKQAAKALQGRPVYFDQGGKITQKLSIHHVPAVVTRDGNTLLIWEVEQKENAHE